MKENKITWIDKKINNIEWSTWHILPIWLLFALNTILQFFLFQKDVVATLLCFGLVVFIFIKTVQTSINIHEDIRKYNKYDPLKLIGIYAIYFFSNIAVNVIINTFIRNNIPQNQTLIKKLLLDNNNIVYTITMCLMLIVVGPMIEELIYRYYLCKKGKYYKSRVMISLCLFILVHSGFNIINLIQYLPMAASLTFVRVHFNSIRYSFAYHVLMNIVATTLIILTPTITQ